MKRTILATIIIFACLIADAQGNRQLDSLRYILPEFTRGTVIFADKTVKSGVLNISPIDQAVYCLSEKNDTLYIATYPDIISVSAAGRFFFGWKNSFVEVLANGPDNGVGIIRTTMKVNNVKAGAYGMASSTSSTKSYSVDAASGALNNVIIDDPRNYTYIKTVCLIQNGKGLPVNRKSFQKLFPAQKDFIESVWSEREVSSSDIGSVLAFYNELRRK